MILYRKYGQNIEVTETKKEVSSVRRVSSTKERGLPLEPRRIDSVRRTKRICLRRLLSAIEVFGSPLFITLTFEGSASDILFSAAALSRFQRRLQIRFPNCASLFVPELSPRNRIHFHGLLFGVSQEWGDVKKGKSTLFVGRERRERVFAKLWGYGFVDLLQTDGSPRLAHYVAKYVAKSSYEPFLTPIRLVRSSRNFPKPIEQYFKSREELEFFMKRKKEFVKVHELSFRSSFFGQITKEYYEKK